MKKVIVLVAAPAGAGKTTLCKIVMGSISEMIWSVSATTRKRRGKEKHGVDYYFYWKIWFLIMIRLGCFLEWARVHKNFYGTPVKMIQRALEEGKIPVLDIDVQGVELIKKAMSEKKFLQDVEIVDVFIMPPGDTLDEKLALLRQRLESRGEDTPEQIEVRINNASGEIAESENFSHVVVNGDLDAASEEFRQIITGALG